MGIFIGQTRLTGTDATGGEHSASVDGDGDVGIKDHTEAFQEAWDPASNVAVGIAAADIIPDESGSRNWLMLCNPHSSAQSVWICWTKLSAQAAVVGQGYELAPGEKFEGPYAGPANAIVASGAVTLARSSF